MPEPIGGGLVRGGGRVGHEAASDHHMNSAWLNNNLPAGVFTFGSVPCVPDSQRNNNHDSHGFENNNVSTSGEGGRQTSPTVRGDQ